MQIDITLEQALQRATAPLRRKMQHFPSPSDKNQHRPVGGFSDGSSSVGLTEEQEREIAENIYDWWISGKGYKKWYAEKFLQQKLDFEDSL